MRAGGKGCVCECSCRPPLEERSTYLYRAYSASGDLLYIGITYSLSARMKQHSKGEVSKRWFNQTVQVVADLYENRDTAHVAEQRAIATENPSHNGVSDERLLTTEGPLPRPSGSRVLRGAKGYW